MYTIYQINADELDIQFVESLKILFRHKKIEIAVSELNQSGETEYLLKTPANRQRLLDAIANIEHDQQADQVPEAKHGLVYVTTEDLEKYT